MRPHRPESGLGTYRSAVEVLCETGLDWSNIEWHPSKLFPCDYLTASFDLHQENFGLFPETARDLCLSGCYRTTRRALFAATHMTWLPGEGRTVA